MSTQLAKTYRINLDVLGGEEKAYAVFPVSIGSNDDLHITVAFLPHPRSDQLEALEQLFNMLKFASLTTPPTAVVKRHAIFFEGSDRDAVGDVTVPEGAVPVLVVELPPLHTYFINQYAREFLEYRFNKIYPTLHITCPVDPVTRSIKTPEFATPIGTSIPITRVTFKRGGVEEELYAVSLENTLKSQ